MSTNVTPGTPDTVLSATNANYRKVAVMSATKAIVTYRKASDTYPYARCVDIAGTTVSHPGAEIKISASASPSYAMDIVRLTDTKAVAIFAYDSTNRPIARVIDLSGSTLSTPGSETSSFIASTSGFFSGARLSDSSMLAVWSTGSTAKAAVLSGITAGTITVNAVADVEATGISRPAIASIDASRVLLTYFQSGSLMAEILDISGTTVTGTNTAVSVDASPDTASTPEVAILTDGGHAVVAYRKSGSLDISLNVLTITGSSLAAGTAVNYGTLDAYQDGYSLVPLTDENVLLAYYDYNDSWKPKAVIVSALNTVLGTIATVSATGGGTDQDMDVITAGTSLLWITTGSNNQAAVVLSYDSPAPPSEPAVPIPLPMLTASLYGGSQMRVTLPAIQGRMLGGTRALHTLDVTLPMITADMHGGGGISAELPMITATMSGTTTVVMSVDVQLPMIEVSMQGTTGSGAVLRATLPALTGAMRGGGELSGQLPMVEASLSGTTGSAGRLTVMLPMITASMSATLGVVGIIEATLPMLVAGPFGRIVSVLPMMRATLTGRTEVSVTYEAYAVNLKPGERMPNQVTRYTNYPFNQIVRFQGNYYGVASDGLYLLGGDTDYHAVTPTGPSWAVKTAITDFGSSMNKVTRETFLGARLGPAVSASVSIGEAADVTYVAKILRGSKAQNHRVKYGKGLKARYWSFGFSDAAGGQVEIDTLEFDMRETGRKL